MTNSEITNIRSAEFWREDAFINGAWVASGDRFPVDDPANGELIATVTNCSVDQVEHAIAAADQALAAWRSWTGKERGQILRRWFELVMANRKELGALLSLEQGKPLKEAVGEIVYGASFLEWFAEEAKRVYGDVIPGYQRDRRISVLKQPVGVVSLSGVCEAGLTTIVQPAASAGPTLRAIIATGKFHGVIAANCCARAPRP